MTFSELKNHFSAELSELYAKSESRFIFQIFSERFLGLNSYQLRQITENEVSGDDFQKFESIISELKTGKPYQQVLGETEFFGLKFFVDENVLIPRPETEELLEIAISKIQNSKLNLRGLKILDVGAGSGIIPIVLKKHFPDADISAIDFSEKALETAKRNAEFHDLNIKFVNTDYLNSDLNQMYDVIISNPPYIGIDEKQEISDSVKKFEPEMALFSPTPDALIFYKKIAGDCNTYLNKDGLLFLEINQKLGMETLKLYKNLSQYELIKDLSGNDRFVVGVK